MRWEKRCIWELGKSNISSTQENTLCRWGIRTTHVSSEESWSSVPAAHAFRLWGEMDEVGEKMCMRTRQIKHFLYARKYTVDEGSNLLMWVMSMARNSEQHTCLSPLDYRVRWMRWEKRCGSRIKICGGQTRTYIYLGMFILSPLGWIQDFRKQD